MGCLVEDLLVHTYDQNLLNAVYSMKLLSWFEIDTLLLNLLRIPSHDRPNEFCWLFQVDLCLFVWGALIPVTISNLLIK